jgi:hypothetical protein
VHFTDPTRWSDQELELQADETSRKFLAFFIDWFTLAEKHMKAPVMGSMTETIEAHSPVGSTRSALVATEEKLGYLAVEWIGQMLVLASQHWVHGEALVEGMTVMERRMMEQMAAVKMVDLQESATL